MYYTKQRPPWRGLLRSAALVSCFAAILSAATTFNGVGAGDTTSTSAILWTRTGADASLTAQVATDSGFLNIVKSVNGSTSAVRDHTLKLEATGLQSNTVYFYRFMASDATSSVGSFKTAPDPTQGVPVRFGFSGDADGQWRPYASINQIATSQLDFFVFLGDTIYETKSNLSPAVADPFTNPAQALLDYRRKYLENISPVIAGGQPSLEPLFTAFGHYTLLDNHETGNKQFQAGGAPQGTPPGAGVDASNSSFDVNTSGAYMNTTTGFLTLLQAYSDYQPIRELTISAPQDPRTDATQQLYNSQQWGSHVVLINLDDRSYRDIRLKTASGADDTGPRADNPNRTMLGVTELPWFEQKLLDAQKAGVTWKFVSVSSPIDILGGDGGKSWQGGYRVERNKILKFIADYKISHVVFLTTDDHQFRINELTYLPDPTSPNNYQRVPGCFELLAGPIGAGGPDAITDHSFANIKALADAVAASQISAGIDPIGLDSQFPGLHDVVREGDANADTLRQPFDFYSPDTFNYAALQVSADGKTLAVDILGINSYAANTYPEPGATGPPRHILGFQVDAFNRVTNQIAVRGTGFVYSRATKLFATTLTVTNNSGQPITGPIEALFSNLPAGISLTKSDGLFNGAPYLSLPATLNPGQSASFQVQFSNPSFLNISYALDFYSGAL